MIVIFTYLMGRYHNLPFRSQISSHILGELSKIATHYEIISNGQMVKELSAQELEQTCQNYLMRPRF